MVTSGTKATCLKAAPVPMSKSRDRDDTNEHFTISGPSLYTKYYQPSLKKLFNVHRATWWFLILCIDFIQDRSKISNSTNLIKNLFEYRTVYFIISRDKTTKAFQSLSSDKTKMLSCSFISHINPLPFSYTVFFSLLLVLIITCYYILHVVLYVIVIVLNVLHLETFPTN